METQELVLESLVEFCKEPTLMVDLYVNYDCDVMTTYYLSVVTLAVLPLITHQRLIAGRGEEAVRTALRNSCTYNDTH